MNVFYWKSFAIVVEFEMNRIPRKIAHTSSATCLTRHLFALNTPYWLQFELTYLWNLFAVHEELRQFFVRLLRKIRKSVQPDKVDSALAKFCYTYSAQDAWEVERFGYKQASLAVKLRILKVN